MTRDPGLVEDFARRAARAASLRPRSDAGLTHDVARTVVDAAPDGIIVVDESAEIAFVNPQAVALFGYDAGELLGRSVHDLLPERLRAEHRVHHAHYRAAPRTRPMGTGLSLFGRRRDGSEFPVEISLSPMTADDRSLVVAVVRDVTERVEAEDRLRQTERELHTLEDHERIARDLHDVVIQQLFASGMTLQSVWSRVREPEVAQRISAVVDDLDRTIREIRSVIFGLQTHGADAPGRRAEILGMVSEYGATLESPPRVRFEGPIETIDDEIAAQLLPTLREALSNAARHSKASSVDVTVVASDRIVLRVADDGIGLPDAAPGSGRGVRNMSERAAQLGGRCDVQSRPEGGTVVEWSVPVPIG
jgi:PAS domain S-box-containing protein